VWLLSAPIYLGEIAPEDVAVQLYAELREAEAPFIGELTRDEAIIGPVNAHIYCGAAPTTRSPGEYTIRIILHHPGVQIPAELALIRWQK
jgi:glycogen phosphorylase